MTPVPLVPSVWEQLPGCILASSGPCLWQKFIQDTAPGLPNSFLLVFPPDGSITSPQSSGVTSLPRAALISLQCAPSSPKGV